MKTGRDREDPLVALLREALTAAQHRHRTRTGWGALVTPAVPPAVIEVFSAAIVPIMRQAAQEAVLADREAPR